MENDDDEKFKENKKEKKEQMTILIPQLKSRMCRFVVSGGVQTLRNAEFSKIMTMTKERFVAQL